MVEHESDTIILRHELGHSAVAFKSETTNYEQSNDFSAVHLMVTGPVQRCECNDVMDDDDKSKMINARIKERGDGI